MDQPTVDELMLDLLAVVNGPKREDGEFLADELAEKEGVTSDIMAKRMLAAYRRGELTRRKLFVDGRIRFVYRLAK